MATTLTEAEFDQLLGSFDRSAFRLETRDVYALGYERADFERFLTGSPVPPPEVDWWRPWLDQIATFTRQGKTISRVRVVRQPPTDYQRWELWAAPWHAEAGEQISYMPRYWAKRIGLPLDYDWWLLDEERLIVMRFDDDGESVSDELVTDPEIVAKHLEWRDLAVRNATPAAHAAA